MNKRVCDGVDQAGRPRRQHYIVRMPWEHESLKCNVVSTDGDRSWMDVSRACRDIRSVGTEANTDVCSAVDDAKLRVNKENVRTGNNAPRTQKSRNSNVQGSKLMEEI